MSAILPNEPPQTLALTVNIPADQHPALVYWAWLGSDHSRCNMSHCPDQIADLLTSGGCDLG